MADMMTFTVTGNVEEKLLALDTAVSPVALAEFLGAEVDPYIRGRAANRFRNEGDDVVGKWSQLRAATVAYREAEGYPGSHPINVRSGKLEDFIIGHRGIVVNLQNGAYFQMPGNVPGGELGRKYETAQKGRRKPHTVARPVLGMNPADTQAVLMMLFNTIKGAV